MRKTTLFKLIAVIACLAMLFAGCNKPAETTPPEGENPVEGETPVDESDLNSYTLDEIIEKAKAEGHLESVGMPDSWANWGETWEEYTAAYGITHADTDMSSAEELTMFANDPTRAIGDVGIAFTKQAVEDGLVQSYKTTNWDSVPDWAKDADGNWMVAYTGCTAFVYNTTILGGEMPKSWADVRTGDYSIAIGDVVGGATGQGNVIATAYAFGGDIDNLEPAYEFWKEMAEAGRINKLDILLQNFESGEVPFGVVWSYNAVNYKNTITESKGYDVSTCIPSDGAILVGYASVISKTTDTPFAAALAREYIFSDEGQINLAKSGAIPTRTNLEIPADAQVFDPAEYANAVGISDAAHYAEVCTAVGAWWNDNIIPLLG